MKHPVGAFRTIHAMMMARQSYGTPQRRRCESLVDTRRDVSAQQGSMGGFSCAVKAILLLAIDHHGTSGQELVP